MIDGKLGYDNNLVNLVFLECELNLNFLMGSISLSAFKIMFHVLNTHYLKCFTIFKNFMHLYLYGIFVCECVEKLTYLNPSLKYLVRQQMQRSIQQ